LAETNFEDRSIIWTNVVFFAAWTAAAAVAVPWYTITYGVTWIEVAACIVLWFAMGVSITAGYHRLFAHRAYAASGPVRFLFALFGAAAWQSSIIDWAAHHRFHHQKVDTDQDPYNAKEGFWHSHMGWLLVRGAKHDDHSNVPDLRKDPICRWQHRHWLAIAIVVNLLVTIGLGLLTGRMLGMFVYALFLRVFLLHHATWLINSAAHKWGSQRWSTGHTARDNWFLSLLTFGEGYHNYHHTFQADYRNGPVWHNWDPTKWLIWTMSRIGLSTNLRRVPVDVTLSRRFEQARDELGAQIDRLGDRARTAINEHIAVAERRIDEALGELRAARERWQAAIRDPASRGRRSRQLRRTVRAAQRAAERALHQWQATSSAMIAELAPA
jgi:stearoyl-CoA desaturase (delta-9 desaturase)